MAESHNNLQPQIPNSPVEHLQQLLPPGVIGRRVLVLASESEVIQNINPLTGEVSEKTVEKFVPFLDPLAESGNVRGGRSRDADDFNNPVYVGNHYNMPPLEESARLRKIAHDSKFLLSEYDLWLLAKGIEDKSSADQLLIDIAKEVPPVPANLRTQLEKSEIEKLAPTDVELTPSIKDFDIDLNKLARSRRTLCQVADSHGREPGEQGYTETLIPSTYVRPGDVRRYLVENPMDKRTDEKFFEAFLKHAEATEHPESLRIEKAIMKLAIMAGKSINEGRPWSIEKLEAMDNEAMTKEILESTGTGPDDVVRYVLKYHKNSKGIFVDDQNNPLNEKELIARGDMIKAIRRNPQLLAALYRYDKKKRSPEEYENLINHTFKVGLEEAGLPVRTVVGHIVGEVYADASHGNIGKQSYITHPVKVYEHGPKKGMEIWETKVDPATNNALLLDVHNHAVKQEYVLYDNAGNPYYLSEPGNANSPRVDIVVSPPEIEYDAGNRPFYVQNGEKIYIEDASHIRRGRLMKYNPDGSPEMCDVVDKNGITRQVHKSLTVPAEYKLPVIDFQRLELGQLKIKEACVELGIRWAGGQFALEPAQLVAYKDVIVELVRRLDRHYYAPGFVDQNGSTKNHRLGGRMEKRKPMGRETQEYREALFCISMLWMGITKGLTYGMDPEKLSESNLTPEMLLRMGVGADPRMQGAGALPNRMLIPVAELLEAAATKHPAAKRLPWGDFVEIQRQFKS